MIWTDEHPPAERSLTVYDQGDAEWQPIGILGPDGEPLEALMGGMEPIGFLHDFISIEEEDG